MEFVSLLRGVNHPKRVSVAGKAGCLWHYSRADLYCSHRKQQENLILILRAFTSTFYYKTKLVFSTSIAGVLMETRFLNGLAQKGVPCLWDKGVPCLQQQRKVSVFPEDLGSSVCFLYVCSGRYLPWAHVLLTVTISSRQVKKSTIKFTWKNTEGILAKCNFTS